MELQDLVKQIIAKHDGVRPAALALEIHHGYLSRLASGERTEPSEEVLRKLGLRRVVAYEVAPKKPARRRQRA